MIDVRNSRYLAEYPARSAGLKKVQGPETHRSPSLLHAHKYFLYCSASLRLPRFVIASREITFKDHGLTSSVSAVGLPIQTPGADILPLLQRMASTRLTCSSSNNTDQRNLSSSNMLYPKEDRITSKLMFACRTCQFSEEASSSCVFRNNLYNTVGETAGVTQDVGNDPTVGLPFPACAVKFPGHIVLYGTRNIPRKKWFERSSSQIRP